MRAFGSGGGVVVLIGAPGVLADLRGLVVAVSRIVGTLYERSPVRFVPGEVGAAARAEREQSVEKRVDYLRCRGAELLVEGLRVEVKQVDDRAQVEIGDRGQE